MNSWYLTSTYIEPYLMLGVTADALSANFGNFGMRFNNLEPRIPYGNNSAGGDREVTNRPWEDNYSTLGAANDVIRAIRSGVEMATPAATVAYQNLSLFTRAASLMNLALIFDRAFVVNEEFNASTDPAPELQPFQAVADTAAKWFDELIAANAGQSFTYTAATFPMVGGLTSVRLGRIANTMEALLLAYTPRRAADVAGVNWAK